MGSSLNTGFISTYPPIDCGIGIYTQKLANAMLQNEPGSGIRIFAPQGAVDFRENGLEVSACFSRKGDYADILAGAVRDSGISLVHVQQGFEGLVEGKRMESLVTKLHDDGIIVVVTFHTVYGPGWYRMLFMHRPNVLFHRKISDNAHIVVHNRSSAQSLIRQGVGSERITVIAHGTTRMEKVPKKEARKKLGLPDDGFIFLVFGFIHAQKNIHTIAEAFKRAAVLNPDVRLLVAGSPGGGHAYNRAYAALVRKRLEPEISGGRVFWHQKFIPGDAVPLYYSACDVVLLPHAFQLYDSVSGVFHQAMGAEKPVICARSNKFKEVMSHVGDGEGIFVRSMDTGGWKRAMLQMAGDEAFRKKVSDSLVDYAEKTEWTEVAQSHYQLYRSLIDG